MEKLGKLAMTLGAMTAMVGSNSPYSYFDSFVRKGSSQKDYKNKNANIEYYTDEKGNIRKRKIKMAEKK